MGSLRVTVCTSVLAAVALAPAAHAADGGSVSVTPAAPAPGSDVTLRVTGCAQRTAVAASAAFVADARLTVTGASELAGESRVRSTTKAGSYPVRVTCGATRQTGTLTVRNGEAGRPGAAPEPVLVPGAGGQPPAPGKGGQPSAPGKGGQPSAPGADEEAPPSLRPGAPASPVAPVRAGGGGAAALLAAEESGAAPGTAQGVTGLVLVGVAALLVALRGVRRGRGQD
ncbi:hypothetical protein [Streptomyces cahuitamycinicus]|uniref:Uncharacterized protein n=1 Tax=Streptomyces cahuitamycinicus TaxID=2070367 RepID=A0A2N8TIA4_9ACTN|nr:hypothetical protein [Streptomyces cahuitamycinicus]PNG18771.1 hypothetical protein C1J00_29280 [Streptomyces cahuitamycinicus]